jgi:MFS family permease
VTPIEVTAFGGTQVLGGAFFAMFGAFAILGLADSVRLPASMALFVSEAEEYDAVASSFSLRSISWKVGQVTGPVLIGAIKEFVSPEAAFFAAAGFIGFATAVFAVTSVRASRRDAAAPAAGD